MVEDLLPEGALGPIEHGEDRVHQQVVPRAIVQNAFRTGRPSPRPMVLRDHVHPAHAIATMSPIRARLLEQLIACAVGRPRGPEQQQQGENGYGEGQWPTIIAAARNTAVERCDM
jgi:hypothetical protein